MEFYAVKKMGVLKPYDRTEAEKLHKMREGEAYKVKVSMLRNVRFHRKFFALLGIVFDNLPESIGVKTPDGQQVVIRSVADLLWQIKMQIGHYEQKITLGGKITYEAKSISFASMDEAEFQDFYSQAVDVILKYFLPESNREELEEVVAMEFG